LRESKKEKAQNAVEVTMEKTEDTDELDTTGEAPPNAASANIAPEVPLAARDVQTTNEKTTDTSKKASMSVDQAHEELDQWIKKDKLSKVDTDTLKLLLKDYDSLKEKVGKLKSLLGRSAKAQREAKVDLEATQKRLDQALREIERLNKKIDKLANRPTHMELLADFETNFDRAILSMGQAGGQDTAPPPQVTPAEQETQIMDGLLMQELAESKQRIEKLENLNNALMHRSSQLESDAKERKHERDELANKISRLELEKRMAVMEAEHANKAMEEKAASLAEMQMEIELVTKASVNANARAAHGEELAKTVKTDKQHVQQLEAQVHALQEWARAAAEAKTLAQERVRLLENQLRAMMQTGERNKGDLHERVLWTKTGSLVVGAGDVAVRVIPFGDEYVAQVKLSDRVVLRWKFDLTTDDVNIDFSILKGACDTPEKRKQADYVIKHREVKGGAAGDTENAFAVQNACTFLWSNVKSWIRPKTVKYEVQAVVIPD